MEGSLVRNQQMEGTSQRLAPAGKQPIDFQVMDLKGNVIKSKNYDPQSKGIHQMTFDLSNLPNQVFFVKGISGGKPFTEKVIVLK